MSLEAISGLLQKATGLDVDTVGLPVIRQAIDDRMAECNINNYSTYYTILNKTPGELQALINETMVPETWFFRGQEPFVCLRSYVMREWMLKPDKDVLRILTIPCSTGEEPYSVAITLIECGLKPSDFAIDAIDVSTQSLEMAKEAVYTDHSFRGVDPILRKNYFSKIENGYRLNRNIRDLVKFEHGNILSLDCPGNMALYDIIFCRNLLIYFNKETQDNVLGKLHFLLKNNGILFIGHGEAGCMVGHDYKSIGKPSAFAYSKSDKEIFVPPQRKLKTPLKRRTNQHNNIRTNNNAGIIEECLKKKERDPTKILEDARQLANIGRLAEAEQKCRENLETDGPSAEAFYLLGVILDAQGNKSGAEYLYKRAIYLCPDHYQSLIHLASHAERQGDMQKAEIYRSRSEKHAVGKMRKQ